MTTGLEAMAISEEGLSDKPEMRETLNYKLMQLLRGVEDILRGTGYDLTWTELQLINEGKQNYGEEAFTRYILPHYIAIKQEYGFPINGLKEIVEYPNEINSRYKSESGTIAASDANKTDYKYKPSLDTIAASVGEDLQEYKKALDHNKNLLWREFNVKITGKVIHARLVNVTKAICHSPHKGH